MDIGVIGGAGGPTTICVTSEKYTLGWKMFISLPFRIVIIFILALILIVKINNGSATFSSTAGRLESLDVYKKLLDSNAYMKNPLGVSFDECKAMFLQGKSAMFPATWVLEDARKANMNIAYCNFPTTNDANNLVLFLHILCPSLPTPDYTEEEKAYAKTFKEGIPLESLSGYRKALQAIDQRRDAADLAEKAILEDAAPFQHQTGGSYSTDVGDVSWIVPTGQFYSCCWVAGTPGDSWLTVAQGKFSIAHKGLLAAAKVLGVTAPFYVKRSIIL